MPLVLTNKRTLNSSAPTHAACQLANPWAPPPAPPPACSGPKPSAAPSRLPRAAKSLLSRRLHGERVLGWGLGWWGVVVVKGGRPAGGRFAHSNFSPLPPQLETFSHPCSSPYPIGLTPPHPPTLLLKLAQLLCVLLGRRNGQREQQSVPWAQPLGQLQVELWRCRRLCRCRRCLWSRPCCGTRLPSRRVCCCFLSCLCRPGCRRFCRFCRRTRGGDGGGGKVAGPHIQVELFCHLPACGAVQQQQPLLLPGLGATDCVWRGWAGVGVGG